MIIPGRWELGIINRGTEAHAFATEFFKAGERQLLLIAGAGFDPRATGCSKLLSQVASGRVQAVLLREQRPNPVSEQVRRAEANLAALSMLLPGSEVFAIDIFSSDNAFIGGRKALDCIRRFNSDKITDVVVDCSALSRGITFPVIRFLLEDPRCFNVHVFVADEPFTDTAIEAVAWERADYVTGFMGTRSAERYEDPARLWLPQLIEGQRTALDLIYRKVQPHDVCPVLPFPTSNPRISDCLFAEYATELQTTWAVDPRSIVYADESDPYDLYRSILRLDDWRSQVFSQNRGSQITLSPIGTKLLSLGAMLAAIERDFPVVYVEAVEYRVDFNAIDNHVGDVPLVHLWLKGEAYEA